MSRKFIIVVALGLILSAYGHSQMRCAKYNKATGECSAPVRDSGYTFMRESNLFNNGGPICQSNWANPINSYYGNGASCPDWAPCPQQMGSYAQGESFSVMWFARNHAVANQNPATVFLYLSPVETANQGADVTQAVMNKNLICSGPFANCNGKSGNEDPCTLDCKIPSNLATGIYTLWWKWDWQGVMYTTCADINISGSGSGSGTPSPAPTPSPSPPSQSTTGKAPTQQSTTGKVSTPSSTTRQAQGGINAGNLCYLSGTPNLNGKLDINGKCGSKNRNARCPDGSCCSEYGYCGSSNLYCNSKSQYDYRKYDCSTLRDEEGIVANEVYNNTDYIDDGEEMSSANGINQSFFVALFAFVSVIIASFV